MTDHFTTYNHNKFYERLCGIGSFLLGLRLTILIINIDIEVSNKKYNSMITANSDMIGIYIGVYNVAVTLNMVQYFPPSTGF